MDKHFPEMDFFKFAFTEANGTVLWTNDGTGGNGTEPTGAVSVAVSDGRYSLALGDVSLANMRPFLLCLYA